MHTKEHDNGPGDHAEGTRVVTVLEKRRMREFADFPRRLYAGNECWVPFFNVEYRDFLLRRHPFFAHAQTEFVLVERDGVPVARAMLINNQRYNTEHAARCANFYFTDFIDDDQVADELFSFMARWAADRGLTELRGPLFSGATYGGGVLIEGFEHPAAMTMMPYNAPYYQRHYERLGFTRRFDLNSLGIDPEHFVLPDRVERLAEHVRRRGRLRVVEFHSKRDLRRVASRVGALYNTTLADHAENYPLTEAEIAQLIKDLLTLARPDLEKIITYDGAIVGFMLAFPDVTRAMQRADGRLGPRQLLDLMHEMKQPERLILNGMGILPQFQRLGGNALIYSELSKTVRLPQYHITDGEMVQINEDTDLMLSDMYRLGARRRKLHRVYERSV